MGRAFDCVKRLMDYIDEILFCRTKPVPKSFSDSKCIFVPRIQFSYFSSTNRIWNSVSLYPPSNTITAKLEHWLSKLACNVFLFYEYDTRSTLFLFYDLITTIFVLRYSIRWDDWDPSMFVHVWQTQSKTLHNLTCSMITF